MQRQRNLLVIAVLGVALSGCAVLVQYGDPEVQVAAAYQGLTELPDLHALETP